MVHIYIVKAGGTTVGSKARMDSVVSLLEEILEDKNNYAILVASAMKKADENGKVICSITDVIASYRDVIRLSDLGDSVRQFKDRVAKPHFEWINELGLSENKYLKDTLTKKIGELTRKASIIKQLPYSKANDDSILPFGEYISIEVISAYLKTNKKINNLGYNIRTSTAANIGILTDGEYGDANILSETCRPWVRRRINSMIKGRYLLVVSGFDGVHMIEKEKVKERYTTTLGRQGSDTTALFLGEALSLIDKKEKPYDSVKVYLIKDTPGVMSGNPKIISEAVTLKYLNYKIAASAGNIHTKSIDYARRANITTTIFDPSIKDRKTEVGPEDVEAGIYLVLDPVDACYLQFTAVERERRIFAFKLLEDYEERGLRCLQSFSEGEGCLDFVIQGNKEVIEQFRKEMEQHLLQTDLVPVNYFKMVGNITPKHSEEFNNFVKKYNPLTAATWRKSSTSLTCALPKEVDPNEFIRKAHNTFVLPYLNK